MYSSKSSILENIAVTKMQLIVLIQSACVVSIINRDILATFSEADYFDSNDECLEMILRPIVVKLGE